MESHVSDIYIFDIILNEKVHSQIFNCCVVPITKRVRRTAQRTKMMTRLTHLPLFLMIQMTAAGRNGQALAKTEFMRNMNRAAAEHNLPLYSEEQLGTIARKERLHRNLLKNAISVKALKSSDKPESVDIEGTETDHRQLADEYADTSSINLLSYSLKYQGCASLSSYSDEKAYSDESSVMSTKQFVNFRLCPSNSCSNSTKNGCGYGYGEYLIPMSEYLTSFIGYKQETFQQYCNYCKQCMYFENYFYGNRNLEDQHACKYYDACEDYSDVCSDDDDNNEESSTFSDCSYVGSGYNDNGGGYFYAGPYCDSDQSTIKIGLYSDQYCTKYLYDSSDISDYTGDDMDETSLSDLSRGDCISCRKSVSFGVLFVTPSSCSFLSLTTMVSNPYHLCVYSHTTGLGMVYPKR